MRADDYWRQFVHTASLLEPCVVHGVLTGRDEGGPKDDPYPVLILTLESGFRVKLNVTQTRLLAELIKQRPALGDHLEIVYHGATGKTPPGLSPVKEFTVTVTRQGAAPNGARRQSSPQSPNRPDEPNGEVSENDKGTGGNSNEAGP